MDITFLLDDVNLLTLGICLCVGFALKEAFPKFNNQYIPLFALVLGCVINVLSNLSTGISAQVVLGGMISGLASTGLYEMMRNLLDKGKKKGENQELK